MELAILRKKLDGFRSANGSIQRVSPEVLWELRQSWEHFAGSPDDFRRELGVKQGTLRNLLVESKKLNHLLASAEGLGLGVSPDLEGKPTPPGIGGHPGTGRSLELVYDRGEKVIRFPNVDTLVEFLKKAA